MRGIDARVETCHCREGAAPRSGTRKQHRRQLTPPPPSSGPSQRTMAITPRPPSRPPGPALCESARGGAESDLRGGRSGSTGPHGQKAGPARSSTNGGQVPRRRHHYDHPGFRGVLRRQPDGKGAGGGWWRGVGVFSIWRGGEVRQDKLLDTTISIRLVCLRLILIYSLTEYY